MSAHALLLPKREVHRVRQMLDKRNWLVKIRDVDPCAEKMFHRAEDDSDIRRGADGPGTEAAPDGCRLIEVTAMAERALVSVTAHDDAENIRELRRFMVRLEPQEAPGALTVDAGMQEQLQSGPPPQFTFADLFCGVGGFACGLGSGGFEGLKGRCLLACDSDVQARDLYVLNHGTPAFGISDDVCSLRRLPKGLDLLSGGFPCQSFSNAAGDPKGFACERNGLLFFEIPRLLCTFQNPETEAPKTLLLENVGNLLRIDGGKVIEVVVAELERCGYDVTYKLLASDTVAGLAQRRERVYIVGFRKDLAGAMARFSFPEEEFAPAGSDAPGRSAAAVKDILETPGGDLGGEHGCAAANALRESRLTPHQWLKVTATRAWLTSVNTHET